jgi:tetratricopeptide (TPR) repeat protein
MAMRASLVTTTVLGISLLSSNLLQAGLYNTAEPVESPTVAGEGVKALGFSQFEDVLSTLIGIGVQSSFGSKQSESPKRKQYLARRDELEAKARTGRITLQERINLSAYLIRLLQYDEAVKILEPVAAQERQNFMLFANLATAHQLAGRLGRTLAYLEQTKDIWPTTWPGFTTAQLKWFRTAEKYQLELVKLRYRELARAPGGRATAHEKLDDLFHGDKGSVRFIGESGQYEPGKLATAERAKLPADALAIVQQLVIWLPEDARLYWLLGELYNANGDIDAAGKIFDECVGNIRRFSAPDLRAHRMVVQEAKPKVASPLLDLEASSAATLAEKTPARSSVPSWLPDSGQLMVVGGLAGLVVIVLVYFQVREMRRRRRSV